MKLPDDAIIVHPVDLANLLGDYLLIVGEDGKPDQGTEVPKDIRIRYEPERDLLYIDRKIFNQLDLVEKLEEWRKRKQYCGVMVKRLGTGTGRTTPPLNVVVFDMLEDPDIRKDPIRTGHGKPLMIEKKRKREAVAKKATEKIFNLHERMSELRLEHGKHPLIKEMEEAIKEARRILEEANIISNRGPARPNAGRRKPIRITQAERVHIAALDDFVKENIGAMHRLLERSIRVDGRLKQERKERKPSLPESDWLGRYEEITNEKTGKTTKTLYIPVSVLKAVSELCDFQKDYRFAGKKYRTIGRQSVYCAIFYLNRPFRGVDKE